MIALLKVAALGAIVLLTVGALAAPVMGQERLCLRFDNKSLVSSITEGEDAYDRAAALGNRCFTNQSKGVTILPAPQFDPADGDYDFLPRSQRELLHLTD